jgi:hypothetical protein
MTADDMFQAVVAATSEEGEPDWTTVLVASDFCEDQGDNITAAAWRFLYDHNHWPFVRTPQLAGVNSGCIWWVWPPHKDYWFHYWPGSTPFESDTDYRYARATFHSTFYLTSKVPYYSFLDISGALAFYLRFYRNQPVHLLEMYPPTPRKYLTNQVLPSKGSHGPTTPEDAG